MKKFIIPAAICALLVGAGACTKNFLDLKPLDTINETSYFTTPDQFKYATNDFYEKMISWEQINGSNIFDFMDMGSDISGYVGQDFQGKYGHGSITVPLDDIYYSNPYAYIRAINIVLKKADAYKGKKDDIKQYIAAAKFFRAWQYFFLLKRFGGVPLVTTIPDVEGEELNAPRNSRYEVVDQILADLNDAIAGLPTEQAIPSSEKGHVSKWAAEAFKARVLLYEATWRKYTGTSTDFKGSAGPATDQVKSFLTEAVALAKDVIVSGGYKLWNYNSNSAMGNRSNYYLFCIDGSGSNPAGLDKTTNNEFILKSMYDINLRPGGILLSHTVQTRMLPNRKLMDMFLCTDGLPVNKSSKFGGYQTVDMEYANRDYRMQSYVLGATASIPAKGSITLDGDLGYTGYKFSAYKYPTYRTSSQESQDYPQIRLAEIYLIYAEALYENNGAISDAELNNSINLLRARAGVAPLTNALVTNNGLNMLDEIRRERTVELYGECTRYDDLKRWGIAEHELNQDVCGMVLGGASYETEFKVASKKDPGVDSATSKYIAPNYEKVLGSGDGETIAATGKGDLKVILLDAAANRNFKRKHYLYPLPMRQVQLNANLVQNNDY
ncbi:MULTISPECIES: RagB/SusD family nutrient uptake outer membrane protein [Niastella]|uniref:RagB/SusD family nutrient uptake outer membrane protein n=1 Tax=Niastella soli TaxID=2821487 RepID=A0ABS3YRK6_9BACT|nr:RagB/SusD family nutrient uptake outer membrane protein [Niastella soli]MBO9200541.1 RagB/SusD family nutrient uptake outer membrane protein [Niastella soli]